MKKLSVLFIYVIMTLTSASCGTIPQDVEPENTSEEISAVQTTDEAEASVGKKINELIASMSIEERVWQMFLVAPEDIIDVDAVVRPGDMTKNAIEKYPVGGIVCFARNIETREQITQMLSDMQSFSKFPLFMAVDEEGGRVARLGNADVGVTKFPPMAEIGAEGNANRAEEIGITLGLELREIGFNVDFAPVADVITVENNDDIGDRSFGSNPELVASMVSAEVTGMQSQGLSATLKHFPSNGSSSTNTHYASAVCTRTLEEMRNTEFIPFKAGIDAGADLVMVAHMAVPDIVGDETPSTLSPIVINDLLRGELGFTGVVVSDALNMGAITSSYTPEDAALKAVNAGVDLILMSPNVVSAADTIIDAVKNGEISEERINESLYRIFNLKCKRGIMNL